MAPPRGAFLTAPWLLGVYLTTAEVFGEYFVSLSVVLALALLTVVVSSLQCVAAQAGRISTKARNYVTLALTRHQSKADRIPPLQVCLLCAIKEEADAVAQLFASRKSLVWREEQFACGRLYHSTTMTDTEGRPIHLSLVTVSLMGSAATAGMAAKMVSELRPELVIMTGVRGGHRGSVSLGDVVIAKRLFALEGKARTSGMSYDLSVWAVKNQLLAFIEGTSDWHIHLKGVTRPLSKRFKQELVLNKLFVEERCLSADVRRASRCATDEDYDSAIVAELSAGSALKAMVFPHKAHPCLKFEGPTVTLTDHGRQYVLSKQTGVRFPRPDSDEPTAHLASIAVSLDAVREDLLPERWQEIQKMERKAVAVEMEGAGLVHVLEDYNQSLRSGESRCEVLLVKGVMDYCDPDKDDSFKGYAALASAAWALQFLSRYAYVALRGKPSN